MPSEPPSRRTATRKVSRRTWSNCRSDIALDADRCRRTVKRVRDPVTQARTLRAPPPQRGFGVTDKTTRRCPLPSAQGRACAGGSIPLRRVALALCTPGLADGQRCSAALRCQPISTINLGLLYGLFMTTTYTASGNAHPISWVPLSSLSLEDGNVERPPRPMVYGELTASIAAHGVLQSLVVRKTNRGKVSVVAGRRRFLTPCRRSAEGGAGRCPTPRLAVPRTGPAAADATGEISTDRECHDRAAMHPAPTSSRRFRSLINAGATWLDVAARFGISEVRRQKTAAARKASAPKVFEAYRRQVAELTLEQVQAVRRAAGQSCGAGAGA